MRGREANQPTAVIAISPQETRYHHRANPFLAESVPLRPSKVGFVLPSFPIPSNSKMIMSPGIAMSISIVAR